MNADGSGVTRLTDNDADDWSPAWSPDGRRIAFDSNRDGDFEIYVMNADGSGVTRLTDNDADDWSPAWSPDGRRIAFDSDRDGDFEIYVMNADGSGVTRLTDNDADDWSPAWSPDGRRIAFDSNRDGDFEIYVMNADGSGISNTGSSAVTSTPGPTATPSPEPTSTPATPSPMPTDTPTNTPTPQGNAVTGEITECVASENILGWSVRISGIVYANRAVRGVTVYHTKPEALGGVTQLPPFGWTWDSLGALSAGESKSFTIRTDFNRPMSEPDNSICTAYVDVTD